MPGWGWHVPRMTYLDRSGRVDELLGEARSRSDADQALAALLDDNALDSWIRTKAVAALGEVTGPAGSSVVRSEFSAARARFETSKPHNRADDCDLMCACVWALGHRDEPAATDMLVEAAGHASASVRDYGLSVLAAVGDDRAWDDMFAALELRLAKRISRARQAGEVLLFIGYLARHCAQKHDRSARLAGLLRRRWSRLPDSAAQAAAGRYPGVGPGGPPSADIGFAAYIPPAPWQLAPVHGEHGS
jgi:hypothetical protein